MSKIENQVEEIAKGILKLMIGNYELVDVEYVKEKDWYLRIFIDKEGGVGLDDCQKISEAVGKILDEKNLIQSQYILEVSSPGLDRLLRKPRDFVRENGKSVDVTFYEPFDGKKSITGILEDYDGVFLKIKDQQEFPLNKISSVRLHVDF